MEETLSPLELRGQAGRERRKAVPRGELSLSHARDRDPVEMIRASAESRVGALVALRHGRMLASPFAFFRGTANLQAADLAGGPNTEFHFPICGDCHLMNFGGFATPERNLVFDINDFDETHPGPWEWDLKRLAASVLIASRHLGHTAGAGEEAVYQAISAYQARTRAYAQMGALEINYQRLALKDLARGLDSDLARERLDAVIRKAQRRTHEELLPKIAKQEGAGWKIRDSLPTIFHLFGANTLLASDDDWMRLKDWRAFLDTMYPAYRSTLSGERRIILDSFKPEDLAFKVVGVGSVGTRCLVLLLVDTHGMPLFLQIKEAAPSVVAQRLGTTAPIKHQGRRVVEGQRRLQSSSDLFLGWSTGPSGRHFYFRQLRDMKISATIETYDAGLLEQYAATCGWALARAHAKSGGLAPEISGYLGKSDAAATALVGTRKPMRTKRNAISIRSANACQSGILPARTDEDFLADLTV